MTAPPDPRSRAAGALGETVLFWVLLALYLLPLWVFPFFPSQDGPDHQGLSFILRQHELPGAGLLREYYLINREAVPNWFIFFLMSRALGFVSIPVAEKILLTAYVVLFPLSVRYAARAIDRRAGFLAVLCFPFIYNFTFHMGFFNFCFSLPALFFALGYWLKSGLKHPERMGPLRIAGLALLLLWVYFCHPVTLAVAVTVLLSLAGWRLALERLAAPREERLAVRPLWDGVRRWLLGPFLASLPALILMASFLGKRTGARIQMLSLWVKIKQLATLYSLASLTRLSIVFAALLALLFYALAWRCWRDRRGRPPGAADGLLLAVAVLAVAYFAAPSDLAGGGFINHRLLLCPFLVLILWFATFDHPPRRRRAIQIAAAAISVGFLGAFVPVYARLNRGLEEIAAAGRLIPPDHTFVFLNFVSLNEELDPELGAFRTRPFIHAGGYLAARRRLVDLSLYEANENYFPIYFEPRLNPYRYLGAEKLGIELDPPSVDLLGYPKRTGGAGSVDYVFLWGLRDERWSEPKVEKLLAQLAAGYQPVYASRDGRVRLYRVRP
ncbi:MAG TPA: hypothetical protein VGH73_13245 [Thermoanaerobaculia bacterium]|jgi:hypothetical protein